MEKTKEQRALLPSSEMRARLALKAGRHAGELDEANETVLRANWRELKWFEQLEWLALPTDAEGRPVGEIAQHIANSISSDEMIVSGPARIAAISNGDVRNEVLRIVRPTLPNEHCSRFDALGSGGAIFAKIRDIEESEKPPTVVLRSGQLPRLTSVLFGELTNDQACLQRLKLSLGDEHLRLYVLWVLERVDLLSRLGSLDDVLPSVITPVEDIANGDKTRFLLDLASRWLATDERDAWFTRWAIEARSRGVRWEELWFHIPEAIREAVAIASLESDVPAPWAPWSLLNKAATSYEHWQLFFKQVPRAVPHQGLPIGHWVGHVLRRQPEKAELELWRNITCESGWREQMFETPLPKEAGPDFDEAFVVAAHQLGVSARHALQYLVQQPGLSTHRAIALIQAADKHRLLWNWEPLRCLVERGDVRGRVVVEPPHEISENAINGFRCLRGEHAIGELRKHTRRLLQRGAVPEVMLLARLVPEVQDDELREVCSSWARGRTLSEAVALRGRYPFLLSDTELVRIAEAADDFEGLHQIPECLVPIVSAWVQAVPEPREAARLLGLLEVAGLSRREVMDLVVRRLECLGPEALDPKWLGQKLDSNTLWKSYGEKVFALVLGVGERKHAMPAFSICWYSPREESMVRTQHTVVATCFIRLAERACTDGNWVLAARALRALFYLSPASRVGRALRGLRELGIPSEIVQLVELNENAIRHAKKQPKCELGDIDDALSELVGESEDDR